MTLIANIPHTYILDTDRPEQVCLYALQRKNTKQTQVMNHISLSIWIPYNIESIYIANEQQHSRSQTSTFGVGFKPYRPFCGAYANSVNSDQTPQNAAPLFAYRAFY